MAIDFPTSPTTGQQYTYAGVTYTYTAQGVWASAGASGYTASATAPVSPTPGDHWYDLTTGILAIFVNDGNSSQWVQVAPGTADTTAYVRTDITQVFTPAQQTQARSNVYAAPFDALAYSGMQINGSMEISQENGATAVSTALKYIVDGYMIDFTGGVTAATGAQVVDGPPGFVNSIKITIGTSTGAETTVRFLKRIEGTRFSRLAFGTINAQPVTIGFWSKIHRPGLYSVGLRNGNNTRCCALGFTQNVADVWEYKTVTFPGDTTGTWVTDSTSGASVSFCMSVGSAAFITPGVWIAGAAVGVPGMVNILAVTDTFQITGVVVLPGIQAPTAAQSPLIMRPFDQELVMCQRYLQGLNSNGYTGFAVSTATGRFGVSIAPMMRATPTLLPKNLAGIAMNSLTVNNTGLNVGVSAGSTGPGGFMLDIVGTPGGFTGGQVLLATCAAGSLFFDARL